MSKSLVVPMKMSIFAASKNFKKQQECVLTYSSEEDGAVLMREIAYTIILCVCIGY